MTTTTTTRTFLSSPNTNVKCSSCTPSYFEFDGFGDASLLSQLSERMTSTVNINISNSGNSNDSNCGVEHIPNSSELNTPIPRITQTLFSSSVSCISSSLTSNTPIAFLTQLPQPSMVHTCACCGESCDDDKGAWFPWVGLLFHTSSLHVRVDCSRYKDLRIQDCITVDRRMLKAVDIMNKAEGFVCTKSYSILFDSSVNSQELVALNIFQMVFVGIAKLHVLLRGLHPSQRPSYNPDFFIGLFQHLLSYSSAIIQSRCRAARTTCGLEKREVDAVVLQAILTVVNQKQSFYNSVAKKVARDFKSLCQSLKREESRVLVKRIPKHKFNADLFAMVW
eukprot:m.51817 g.51817  ORF g.51817 m.51817 type:complete len:336 (-) comp10967_c0_seq1:933-1940(-)